MAKAKAPQTFQQQIAAQLPQIDLSGLPQNWTPAQTAAVQQEFAPINALTRAQQAALSPAQAYSLLSGGGQLSPAGGGGGGGGQPVTVANPITSPAPAAPASPPPPPPPPPLAGTQIGAPTQPGWGSMDWSGLAGKLQSILSPYLSGQQSAASPGAMGQIMPALMSSLGQYLGTINPGVTNQATASGMAPLGSAGSVNWGGIGSALQNMGSAGQQATTGSLLNSLLGYLGTQPSAVGTTGTTGTGGTTSGVGIGPGYASNMGFDPMTGQWYNPQTGTALTQAPTSGQNPLGFYEASSAQGTPQLYFANDAQKQQYADIMAAEQPYSLANQQTIGGLGMTGTPWGGGGQAITLTPAQIQYIQQRQAGAGLNPVTLG